MLVDAEIVGNCPKRLINNHHFATSCFIRISREFPGMGKDFLGLTYRRLPGNFPAGKNQEASLVKIDGGEIEFKVDMKFCKSQS